MIIYIYILRFRKIYLFCRLYFGVLVVSYGQYANDSDILSTFCLTLTIAT